MTETPTLPPLPEKGYLGDDASYGYDACDMRDYAADAVKLALEAQAAQIAERDAQIEALRADAERDRRLLKSIARTMRLVQLRPSYAVDWSEMLKTIDAAMAAKEQ